MTGPLILKKIWYQVVLGHTRVTQVALVGMSRTNVEMLTNNVAFTTPNPTLAAMTAATDKLEAAIDRYNFSRSRLDKQDRDEAFVSLKTMRADLGAYVQTTSAGDADLITSAGFKMEKARQPIGQLPAPPNVRALVRPYPGSLELRFGGVKGRLSYKTYICMGDPKVEANWQLHSVTGKTRVIIDGLQSDQVYYFRVAALGAAGLSPMSDVSSAKAA